MWIAAAKMTRFSHSPSLSVRGRLSVSFTYIGLLYLHSKSLSGLSVCSRVSVSLCVSVSQCLFNT